MVCELWEGVEKGGAFGLVERRGVRGGGAAVGDDLVFFGGEAATDGGREGVEALLLLGAWVRVGLDGEDRVGETGLVWVEKGKVAGVGIFDKEGTPRVVVGYTGEELAVF